MNFINSVFSDGKLNSRITATDTTKKEMILGYFLGPCFVYMVYYAVAGTYLTQFYTDVLGIGGAAITMMPFFSKIVDAVTNVIMGRIVDKTRTVQGKARPWILISGIFMAAAGVLLYAVPNWSNSVRIVWIIISYNLFFAFAFTIYNISHALMVPLSTRNTKQRDSLAMMTSAGTNMIPGLLVTIILPLMINAIGVGSNAQSRWLLIMGILSMLAIPATLIEYYFTKERITEETATAESANDNNSITFTQQMKACFSNRYWIMIMCFWGLYQFLTFMSTNSMLYYCNWVMSDSVQGGTGMQILVNAIGQAPLGFGIFILWPLVKKFGKRNVMLVGYIIAAIGSFTVLMSRGQLMPVLIGLFVKSLGAVPTYAISAQIAEALDHIEWKNGFRADGFSASVYSILVTVMSGVGQTMILFGINAAGYIAPSSNTEQIIQSAAMQNFFSWGFAGIPMICYVIGVIIMIFFDIEKKMPRISAELEANNSCDRNEDTGNEDTNETI